MSSKYYLLLTPNYPWDGSRGTNCEVVTKEELKDLWDKGMKDEHQFIDHLDFDFKKWNVSTDFIDYGDGSPPKDRKVPAVLLPFTDPIMPIKTQTVVIKTQELDL